MNSPRLSQYLLATIALTSCTTAAPQSAPPAGTPGITEFSITRASKRFDFLVRIHDQKDEEVGGTNNHHGPGEVLIFRKGQARPFQTISADSIEADIENSGQPPVNTTRLYDEQSFVNVGDFNFDGYEDFAIHNGNHGSYGMPSYNVYLYSPQRGRFVLNKPLTDLIEGSLGFFQVDKAHRRLVTMSKSGCCYHEVVQYAVIQNRPVPVSRIVDDGTKEEGYDYVSHQRMVHGQWIGSTKRVPQPKDDTNP